VTNICNPKSAPIRLNRDVEIFIRPRASAIPAGAGAVTVWTAA